MTLGASSLILSGIKSGTTQFFSTKAYFAAEGGVEQALWELRKNSVAPCSDMQYLDFNQDPASCGSIVLKSFPKDNNQTYYAVFIDDATDYIFRSVGDFSDTKRSLEISWPK